VRYLATFLSSQSAYLSSQVPLDYTTNATDAMAAVALVRLPSPLSKDDKDYRGPVLFNPGMLLSMVFVVLLILSVQADPVDPVSTGWCSSETAFRRSWVTSSILSALTLGKTVCAYQHCHICAKAVAPAALCARHHLSVALPTPKSSCHSPSRSRRTLPWVRPQILSHGRTRASTLTGPLQRRA
jgi:hypothetical protein